MSKLLQIPQERQRALLDPLDALERELVIDPNADWETNVRRVRRWLIALREKHGADVADNAEALIIAELARGLYGWDTPSPYLCACGTEASDAR